MADRVILSAKPANVNECIALVVERGLGIELMTFSAPDLLDGGWRQAVDQYRAMLQPVPGMITMHGPFMDMSPGSPDRRISQVTTERYRQAIQIAPLLGVEVIVFHANFLAAIHSPIYRQGWHQRNVDFWGVMAEFAQRHNVTLAVENMWEYEPDIIGDVLRAVNHPSLRACLDVGHARISSDIPLDGWLAALAPFIIHTHLNNNDGRQDAHAGLHSPSGVIDYHAALDRLRALPSPPTMTLEMDSVEDMRASLDYFHLEPGARWRNRLPATPNGANE